MSWIVLYRSGEPFDAEAAVRPLEVVLGRLEQVGGQLASLVADLPRGHRRRGTRDRGRARAVGPEPIRSGVGVAVFDRDVIGRDAELLGDDLGIRRLVPLALGLTADAEERLAGRMDAQLGTVVHLEPDDVEVVGRPGAHDLGEAADANAHELAAGPLLGLLSPELRVADEVHRLAQRRAVVAGVVLPAGRRGVRELLGGDEVPEPEFGRILAALVGGDVDEPLDCVDRLGHAERTAVGDAAGRLVRVRRRRLRRRRLG